jgi:DnaJ family protein C protein 9
MVVVPMALFLDLVETYFGSKDLYAVLGIGKESQDGEIRRAYHRLSLKVHPDRVEAGDVDSATQKFQVS